MNDSTAALLEIRQSEASSVMVHEVPEALTEHFLHWEQGITATARQFPGYIRTEVYPPQEGRQTTWVILVHFERDVQLQHWLDSPERAEWLRRLSGELSTFSTELLSQGFGPWFAGLDRTAPTAEPAGWKMAMVVLLALYPMVMLLTLFVLPRLNGLGLAWSILLSNALSVACLQWCLMPRLTAALQGWLSPASGAAGTGSARGAMAILAALGCMAVLFHMVAD